MDHPVTRLLTYVEKILLSLQKEEKGALLFMLNINKNKMLWQNPIPYSPSYCRHITIRYIKETKDVTKEEISYIQNATKDL